MEIGKTSLIQNQRNVGSNPIVPTNEQQPKWVKINVFGCTLLWPSGGIGRHACLRCMCPKGREGSSPSSVTMISKENIEKLDFIHLGSRWWRNKSDTIRLRQWKDDEIDVYKWGIRENEQFKVFQGRLATIEEIQWVLDRI
jgi:hypothetical protein